MLCRLHLAGNGVVDQDGLCIELRSFGVEGADI